MNLFDDNGASFSECRKYRYALWRIWDKTKPLVMFIGLNPSKADENKPDPTIRRVRKLAMNFGFGGFYMCNCFAYVSTNPDDLKDFSNNMENDSWLYNISKTCSTIVFAWGNFDVVKQQGRDKELIKMFPYAKALKLTKNGSPWHPLLVPKDVELINFINS